MGAACREWASRKLYLQWSDPALTRQGRTARASSYAEILRLCRSSVAGKILMQCMIYSLRSASGSPAADRTAVGARALPVRCLLISGHAQPAASRATKRARMS